MLPVRKTAILCVLRKCNFHHEEPFFLGGGGHAYLISPPKKEGHFHPPANHCPLLLTACVIPCIPSGYFSFKVIQHVKEIEYKNIRPHMIKARFLFPSSAPPRGSSLADLWTRQLDPLAICTLFLQLLHADTTRSPVSTVAFPIVCVQDSLLVLRCEYLHTPSAQMSPCLYRPLIFPRCQCATPPTHPSPFSLRFLSLPAIPQAFVKSRPFLSLH